MKIGQRMSMNTAAANRDRDELYIYLIPPLPADAASRRSFGRWGRDKGGAAAANSKPGPSLHFLPNSWKFYNDVGAVIDSL